MFFVHWYPLRVKIFVTRSSRLFFLVFFFRVVFVFCWRFFVFGTFLFFGGVVFGFCCLGFRSFGLVIVARVWMIFVFLHDFGILAFFLVASCSSCGFVSSFRADVMFGVFFGIYFCSLF